MPDTIMYKYIVRYYTYRAWKSAAKSGLIYNYVTCYITNWNFISGFCLVPTWIYDTANRNEEWLTQFCTAMPLPTRIHIQPLRVLKRSISTQSNLISQPFNAENTRIIRESEKKFPKPNFISFDLFGTIYKPKTPVPEQYHQITSQEFGISKSAESIRQDFAKVYEELQDEFPIMVKVSPNFNIQMLGGKSLSFVFMDCRERILKQTKFVIVWLTISPAMKHMTFMTTSFQL